MDTTEWINITPLQWLRYSLNHQGEMPVVEDWKELYEFAKKQQIRGVCHPLNSNLSIDWDVLSDWMAAVQLIEKTCSRINQSIVDLAHMLNDESVGYCILKGQGNAEMYPEPLTRTPGDIDVWIGYDKNKTYDFIKNKYSDVKESFKHIKIKSFQGTCVDVHYTPLKLYNPIHNRRLQQWINENQEEQFCHSIRLTGTDEDIHVPTARFNAVYQMGHIMIHLLDEGVGLRHLVDYFYLLKRLDGFSEEEKSLIQEEWKKLGMYKLATAIMWVEKNALGLEDRYLLATPHEKRGTLLLEDVLEGGNFGKYSSRQKYRKKYGYLAKGIVMGWHVLQMGTLYPSEVPFKLIGKINTFVSKYARKLRK